MKESYLFSESVSESHPDKMAGNLSQTHQEIPSCLGSELNLIGDFLCSLNCKTIKGDHPERVFGCLNLFDENRNGKTDAVIIDNPVQANQLILLNGKTDCFYFGLDKNGEVSTNGVFPCPKSVGTNVSVVNDRIIVILKRIVLADSFIKLLSTQ